MRRTDVYFQQRLNAKLIQIVIQRDQLLNMFLSPLAQLRAEYLLRDGLFHHAADASFPGEKFCQFLTGRFLGALVKLRGHGNAGEEQLENGRLGRIEDIGEEGVYQGILAMLTDTDAVEGYVKELSSRNFSNESEIEKFYGLL